MSGINQSVVLDVSRLKVRFCDDIGNTTSIAATGFWLKHQNAQLFVTNKHNLDPTLKLGPDTKLRLAQMEIELRAFEGEQPCSETRFFEVNLNDTKLNPSVAADVCILRTVSFVGEVGRFRSGRILSAEHLADAAFLVNHVALMDLASFIGFPGTSTSCWWDEVWNLGVSRTVNIASLPGISFSNKSVRTSDVVLVSGLSFSGSSGSVIILHEKGIKAGAGLTGSGHVPPKIIGIMSGHWWEPRSEPEMFRHSGLSYFTRSTAILELL